jgi:hypothetical protein
MHSVQHQLVDVTAYGLTSTALENRWHTAHSIEKKRRPA